MLWKYVRIVSRSYNRTKLISNSNLCAHILPESNQQYFGKQNKLPNEHLIKIKKIK